MGKCNWPNGTCECYLVEQSKPDPYGRIWMHCESGLTNTKSSLSKFITFCVSNNVQISDVTALSPKYIRSLVLAVVRIHPDQVEDFEKETGGKLRLPPKIKLNGDTGGRPG